MINNFRVSGAIKNWSPTRLIVKDDFHPAFGEVEVTGPAVEVFWQSAPRSRPLSSSHVWVSGQLIPDKCYGEYLASAALRAETVQCIAPIQPGIWFCREERLYHGRTDNGVRTDIYCYLRTLQGQLTAELISSEFSALAGLHFCKMRLPDSQSICIHMRAIPPSLGTKRDWSLTAAILLVERKVDTVVNLPVLLVDPPPITGPAPHLLLDLLDEPGAPAESQ